ncbi:hypothetical protein PIB30_070196 [Stylosanthes scabra]|uniref:Uncharacterized protein n=1 Tax=Stylosanthes scabra TaxID=79078 RepID=A0ABU6UQ42_9FABA|nr:hypothetical protein [Stylosanthes scabra]
MSTTTKQTSSSLKKSTAADTSKPQPVLIVIKRETDTVVSEPKDIEKNDSVLIPFGLEGKTHCFLGPLMSPEEGTKVKDFFRSDEPRELLINQDIHVHAFIKGKSFYNDPKIYLKNKHCLRSGSIRSLQVRSTSGNPTGFMN